VTPDTIFWLASMTKYGTGLDWAGVVIEAVTGTTLESYLVENVLSPLRMGETTFRLTDDQRARLMPIHHRTPDDYSRFLRMLLRGGELDGHRMLEGAKVELAISPQLGAIELPKEMPTADHDLCNDVVVLPFRRASDSAST
jgi:CubicO group peptidase (beta-lactamase class C family)